MIGRRAPMSCEWVVAIMVCIALVSGLCEKANASDPQTVSDVRCVVVGMRMIEMAAPQQRAAGMMAAVYYLGRLDGRAPHANIERLIEREAGEMTAAEFRAYAVRCGKTLTLKGQQLRKIGAALARKGQGGAPRK